MSMQDMLEVINGPEDGTEFPISRAPVIVGMDLGCEVNLRLDETIDPFHARLTVVADGYRIRKIRGGRLLVNGKRAGVFRSRILRAGGILEIGNTELCLRCTPEGLASRSRGLPTESDLFWVLRTSSGRLLGLLRPGGLGRRNTVGRLVRLLLILFVIATAVGFFWPQLSWNVRWYSTIGTRWIMEQINMLTSGPA